MNDCARAGGALLSLKAEGACQDSADSRVQICVIINDNEVLAAHFGYDALDPDLAGPRTSGFFGNVKADLLGSCKCNEPGPGMLYQGIAGRSASPGEKIDDAMSESCLTQYLQEKCGNS